MVHGLSVQLWDRIGGTAEGRVHGSIYLVQALTIDLLFFAININNNSSLSLYLVGVKEGVGEEGRRSRRREGDDGEGGDGEEKNEKFYGILQLIGVSIHM